MQPCRFNSRRSGSEWTCASRYTCFLTVENLLGYEHVTATRDSRFSPRPCRHLRIFLALLGNSRYHCYRERDLSSQGRLGPRTFSAKANLVFCPANLRAMHFDWHERVRQSELIVGRWKFYTFQRKRNVFQSSGSFCGFFTRKIMACHFLKDK